MEFFRIRKINFYVKIVLSIEFSALFKKFQILHFFNG